MKHVKRFNEFEINEFNEDKKLTYDDLLKKAEQKAIFKPGDLVTIKAGMSFEYKNGKPKERWKNFDPSSSKSNEIDLRIEKIVPDTGYPEEQKYIRYVCKAVPEREDSQGEKVWPRLSPRQGWRDFQINEKMEFLIYENRLMEKGSRARVAKIFPHIVKALVEKTGATVKSIKVKEEGNTYSENSVTFNFYKVDSQNVTRVYKTSRDRNQGGYYETSLPIGVFVTKEDAQKYADTINRLMEETMTAGKFKTGKTKVEVSDYMEDITYSEETVLEMCKLHGIDIEEIKHNARGEISAKDLGVI